MTAPTSLRIHAACAVEAFEYAIEELDDRQLADHVAHIVESLMKAVNAR